MHRLHRSLTCAAAALLAGLIAAAAVSIAATPRTGPALRHALPRPGEKPLKGTRTFVGLNGDGNIALAVVLGRDGAVAAFLCDGARTWQWFTGRARHGRFRITGTKGARLIGRIHGKRVTVRVAGKLRTAQSAAVGFSLARARTGDGLFRITDTLDGNAVEGAWIVVSNGRVIGDVTSKSKTVASTNTTSSDTSQTGEANAGGGTGGSATPLSFIRKVRCAAIVLKFQHNSGAILNGTATDPNINQEQEDLKQRFGALNCNDPANGSFEI